MWWLLSVHTEMEELRRGLWTFKLVALEVSPRLLSSGGVETKFATQEMKSGKLREVLARNEHDSWGKPGYLF